MEKNTRDFFEKLPFHDNEEDKKDTTEENINISEQLPFNSNEEDEKDITD